jgi:signal transduction histidine kinase
VKLRRPLFLRIYLHGVALLVLVAGALWFVESMVVRQDREWKDLHVRLAEHLAEHTAPLIESPEALRAQLGRLRSVLGVDLSFYSLDGRLIASNIDPPIAPLEGDSTRELALGAHCTAKDHWHVVAPIRRGGTEAYLILEDSVRRAPSIGWSASMILAVLFVVAAGSIPLARTIATPLGKLTRAVRALGAGDLTARSGITREDEVGELATAFDEMAARLERHVRREKELLLDVSHELRTPLARIRVALDLGSEGDVDGAKLALAEMRADLDELDRLIEDLLTTARLDQKSEAGLRRDRVDVRSVVETAVGRFRSAHPGRALNVEVEGAASMGADGHLLRRAIENLLDNAEKYSDASEPIQLSVRLDPHRGMTLAVRDRGIGIEREDLPRLFTPFFRTDRSRARRTGGVGLGLALVKRVVEAHGGSIAVDSAPEQGTTVRFEIPG